MDEELDLKNIDAALDRAAHKAMHGTREERSGRFMAPKAFVSYSHDSPEHKEWVLKLAGDLRAVGVDVVLDQWDLVPGQDVSLFMQKGISDADRVIMVCSATYVSKAEDGVGGVGFERLVVTAEVVEAIDTKKFIPILRRSATTHKIPKFLGTRLYVDFDVDKDYNDRLIELAREIHGAPAVAKPALGPNPFSGTPTAPSPARAIGPTGTLAPGDKFLGSDWFSQQEKIALGGLGKVSLAAHMELRAGIVLSISKSQIELLNAVRRSEIRTFGWPIGILLENREEYRPRPYGDGIRAEISISEPSSDRTSFDYWALRSSGDFYLLQSLFEDERKPDRVFFDTRIVRVTESLMFVENLYKTLGAPPDTKVGVQISHRGFSGRLLGSASGRRHIRERGPALEDVSTTEILTVLGTMHRTRVDDVRKIVEPMFMLFDFMQFDGSVYDDIVRSFERGEVR